VADPGFKLNGGFLRDDQDRVVFSSGPVEVDVDVRDFEEFQ
jgi:hypothetical protein